MARPMHTRLDLLFEDPPAFFIIVAVVIASIVLHELGHALVATWEGDPTPKYRGHLTWNPVVHMGWLSILLVCVMGIGWGLTPVNRAAFRHRRWGAVLVSGAGPMVNVLLALLGAFVLVVAVNSGAPREGRLVEFWFTVLRYNALLFLFNLIPVPPLDGFSVADGTFDLGELGVLLRRAGFLAFIAAILLVNSDAFSGLLDAVMKALVQVASSVVGG
jgi:Zn-dependent protease